MHYLEIDGKKVGFDRGPKEATEYINTYFDGNGLKFAEKYFETLKLLPSVQKFDILGHFDILVKTNETLGFVDTLSKEYLNYDFDAIHSLKGKIPFLK